MDENGENWFYCTPQCFIPNVTSYSWAYSSGCVVDSCDTGLKPDSNKTACEYSCPEEPSLEEGEVCMENCDCVEGCICDMDTKTCLCIGEPECMDPPVGEGEACVQKCDCDGKDAECNLVGDSFKCVP